MAVMGEYGMCNVTVIITRGDPTITQSVSDMLQGFKPRDGFDKNMKITMNDDQCGY